MNDGRLQLRVALAEDQADYIRYARAKTLEAIECHLHPELTEPLPHAVYLFAFDTLENRPVGVAEACFFEQHWPTYEQTPYAPFCDLREKCPFPQLATIRTVFAEPDARHQRGLYLKLILGQAHIFRSLGARYGAATTDVDNVRLARLYSKTGGTNVGTLDIKAFSKNGLSVYLFELDTLLMHAAAPRMLKDLTVSEEIVRTVRARKRH